MHQITCAWRQYLSLLSCCLRIISHACLELVGPSSVFDFVPSCYQPAGLPSPSQVFLYSPMFFYTQPVWLMLAFILYSSFTPVPLSLLPFPLVLSLWLCCFDFLVCCFFLLLLPPPTSTFLPFSTLFRSCCSYHFCPTRVSPIPSSSSFSPP